MAFRTTKDDDYDKYIPSHIEAAYKVLKQTQYAYYTFIINLDDPRQSPRGFSNIDPHQVVTLLRRQADGIEATLRQQELN